MRAILMRVILKDLKNISFLGNKQGLEIDEARKKRSYSNVLLSS